MQLSIGDRLGNYEILALLGKGGMGEVYRARDLDLKRDVALKVIPAGVARDPDRLARFRREAEILASLNHPGIAAIYGLAENALVMELVEGETLPCPLPVDTALGYCKQIIDAVEYAHDRGVIHRDLKPANIKVTPEGVVKVLDFGLAKALDEQRAVALDPENSPTLTIGATQAGVIMGTAAYMSPEQAMGKAADRRADIFSLGVVFYEMLAGKRAFAGETVGETLAAVAKDPPDWSALNTATPPHLRALLERMLEKDRRQRLQAVGEARLILEREPVREQPRIERSRNTPGYLGWAAAALMVAVAGALYFRTPAATEPPVVQTSLLPPEGAEYSIANPFVVPVISPDGTHVVFSAKRKEGAPQLWIRRLDALVAQPLPGTENSGAPFWSPDSHWVAFGQGTDLKKVDVQGGPPVTVARNLDSTPRGGSWNRDGVIVFSANRTGILKVSAAGGKPVPVTLLEKGNEGHRYPFFLPDGKHFLYVSMQITDNPIRVASIDGPAAYGKQVAVGESSAIYSHRQLLFLRENTLMAQPFDADRLETTGEALPLVEGVAWFSEPAHLAGFSVSDSGTMVYQTGSGNRNELLWEDRKGNVVGKIGEPRGTMGNMELSPDGKRVAVAINSDIWIYDVERGTPQSFTFGQAKASVPVWGPGSDMVYYSSGKAIVRKPADNSRAEETLIAEWDGLPTSVSPDGKVLLLNKNIRNPSQVDIFALSLEQGAKQEPRPFLSFPANEQRGQFSPDGKWVAYYSTQSGFAEVYIRPYPGPGGEIQVSRDGGVMPRWRDDGKELFFVTRTGGDLMAAEIIRTGNSLQAGKIEKLFGGLPGRGYVYDTRDGQKFAVISDGEQSVPPLTLLQNWPAALRK